MNENQSRRGPGRVAVSDGSIIGTCRAIYPARPSTSMLIGTVRTARPAGMPSSPQIADLPVAAARCLVTLLLISDGEIFLARFSGQTHGPSIQPLAAPLDRGVGRRARLAQFRPIAGFFGPPARCGPPSCRRGPPAR